MIEVNNLHAGYTGRTVLTDVTFSVPRGSLTVVIGPNGCGKSTLLKALCGILPAETGAITLAGKPLSSYTGVQRARTVSYLAQSRPVSDLTAEQMVLHGRFPYLSYPRRYRAHDLMIARQAMDQLGIRELANEPLSNLSGGTRQKVYLAMALAQDTPIILLDEPTTYLDIAHQLQILDHARALCQAGKTVMMVLHDLAAALQTADQVIFMANGQLVEQGSPAEIYASGCLDTVFGVHVNQLQTEHGPRYFCEPKGAD